MPRSKPTPAGFVGTTFQQTTVLGTFTGNVTGAASGSFLYNGLRTTGARRSEATYVDRPRLRNR